MRGISPRRERYLIWASLFVAAVALRLIYLAHVRQLPFFDHPIMDAAYHDTWAREILAGKLTRGEPFFRAPLYPYLLALIYLVSKGSYVAPRLVQFVLSGLTCVFTYSLARRYFGRLAGIVAGAVCATYPVLICFDGELLTEPVFIFLSMLGLLLLERARQNQRWTSWLAGGAVLGLAVITRPTIALFAPVALVGAWLFSSRRLVASLAVLAGMLIPVAPVTVHNYAVSKEFVPVVWQGGLNFYLGNNPAATGWSATGPRLRKDWWGGYNDMIAIPRQALGRQPTYNEISNFWTRQGLAFMREQPRAWAGLTLRKIGLFWSSLELPNNQDYNFMRLYSWVLRNPVVGFATVAPLGLVGLFVFLPRGRKAFFLYGLFLASFVGTVAFFVCDRYRLPAVPLLAAFAGGTVSCLVALGRSRAWVRLAVLLACIGVAAVAVNANLTGTPRPDFAQPYCNLGQIYVSLGDDDRAVTYFKKAAEANPAWGEAYEAMGTIRMKRGENQQAVELLLKAVQVWPDYAAPYRSLAMIYLSEKRPAEARKAIEEALRLAPFLEDTYNVLGSIERQEGKLTDAISSFSKELENNPSSWRAYANLGSTYEEMGQDDKAVAAYQKSLDLHPDNPEVVLPLATLYAATDRYDLARTLLDRLGQETVTDVNLSYNRAVILQNSGSLDEARKIYEQILATHPTHEGTLVNLGVVYAKQGLAEQALSLWQRALAQNPANRTAKRNIELLGKPE
jgi:tetratricopeptide (TPR) repeat protein